MSNIDDPTLPPVHRVVTGHDMAGMAVVQSDAMCPLIMMPGGGAAIVNLWSTRSVPADNNDPLAEGLRDTGVGLDGGSTARIIDFLPGTETPMHRTSSLDYGVVLSGEIEVELDDGVSRRVAQGGLIVQRGTIHLWRNPTDVPARVMFIMIEAAPYVHDGQPLPDAWVPRQG